jgi:hypothetical protein
LDRVREELEELNSKERTDLVNARVARLMGREGAESVSVGIADSSRNILTDPEEVRETWKYYIERLHLLRFKYLGSIISDDGHNLVDMKTRIALAKEAFNKRKEFLTKGGLNRTLKKNDKKCWCGQLCCMDARHGRCEERK